MTLEKGRIEFDDPTFRATRDDAKKFGELNRVEGGDGWQLMADFAKATHRIPMTEAEQYSLCGKCGECAYCKAIRSHIRDIRDWAKPIDMLIFCPNCGMQHIDRADTPKPKNCPTCNSPDWKRHPAMQFEGEVQICADSFHNEPWTNPVHKSHTCRTDDGGCGIIFRVADVPTNGVAQIKTKGKDDTWPEQPLPTITLYFNEGTFQTSLKEMTGEELMEQARSHGLWKSSSRPQLLEDMPNGSANVIPLTETIRLRDWMKFVAIPIDDNA